jgi:hypothetical protein
MTRISANNEQRYSWKLKINTNKNTELWHLNLTVKFAHNYTFPTKQTLKPYVKKLIRRNIVVRLPKMNVTECFRIVIVPNEIHKLPDRIKADAVIQNRRVRNTSAAVRDVNGPQLEEETVRTLYQVGGEHK